MPRAPFAVSLLVLTACSSAAIPFHQSPLATSRAYVASHGARYRMLSTFDEVDGANPEEGLVALNGTLYGTTFNGGSGSGGIVFAMTTSGEQRTLHNFFGGGDGYNPYTGLLDAEGTFVADTTAGGGFPCNEQLYGSGCGTVFSITPGGKERVLHRFEGGSDGATPQADLVALDGVFYGTTRYGGNTRCGKLGCGTVFSVTASGSERIVHAFKGSPDGADLVSSLTLVNGTFYGTTRAGGAFHEGTVFTLTPAGKERVLYSFRGGRDGGWPWSTLAMIDGKLYGTTIVGGGSGCRDGLGCGTVYTIDLKGRESVIHRFNDRDGANPQATLTQAGKALFGVAARGGIGCTTVFGCGVIFEIAESGRYSVLHFFAGGAGDGAFPQSDLLAMSGSLYGTTLAGGGTSCYEELGCGTVFRLNP